MDDTRVADSAAEIHDVSKTYRTGFLGRARRVALDGLSLSVRRGEIFGYLGPNGSGKTTTLKILTGLVFADRGSINILGRAHADRAWRYRVGYLPEHPYFYDYLTATEYLEYVGSLFGMSRPARAAKIAELLALVGLEAQAGTSLRHYSKGMLQRLGLAQALINDPELVLLDEPMSGLDPLGRRLVRNVILGLKAAGKSVFFSTHILSDAESLCDRVALLRSGRVLKQGRLDEILQLDVSHMEVLVSVSEPWLAGAALDGVRARHQLGERVRLEVDEGALGSVIRAVEQAGGRVLAVQPIRQSLEDYFFEEIGRGAAERGWTPEA
jgi:ABC-2 type transport system ATP-binding protein